MVPTRSGNILHCDLSTRLGQFFFPLADEHPGLSGFSLLSQGREAFIVRLAAIDLAERSLDMQYYIWDGDTTGRIILDRVMMAADRGVRVRLLVDDPYYKARSPRPITPIPSTMTWASWRSGAPSFATISYGHPHGSSPTTRTSPPAPRATTCSCSSAG